jgi:hypothetical protein
MRAENFVLAIIVGLLTGFNVWLFTIVDLLDKILSLLEKLS